MEKKWYIAVLVISVMSILLTSSPVFSSENFGEVHCEYLDLIVGYYCTDNNQWESMDGYVTQDMRNYYEGTLGLYYPIPQTYPETWTVSNLSP